eukprot:6573864-Karenia_brevis.AAC.1
MVSKCSYTQASQPVDVAIFVYALHSTSGLQKSSRKNQQFSRKGGRPGKREHWSNLLACRRTVDAVSSHHLSLASPRWALGGGCLFARCRGVLSTSKWERRDI